MQRSAGLESRTQARVVPFARLGGPPACPRPERPGSQALRAASLPQRLLDAIYGRPRRSRPRRSRLRRSRPHDRRPARPRHDCGARSESRRGCGRCGGASRGEAARDTGRSGVRCARRRAATARGAGRGRKQLHGCAAVMLSSKFCVVKFRRISANLWDFFFNCFRYMYN